MGRGDVVKWEDGNVGRRFEEKQVPAPELPQAVIHKEQDPTMCDIVSKQLPVLVSPGYSQWPVFIHDVGAFLENSVLKSRYTTSTTLA